MPNEQLKPVHEQQELMNELRNITYALNRICYLLDRNLLPDSEQSSSADQHPTPTQAEANEVMNVKEAAKLMRLSLPKMYELAESGVIRSVRVGRRVLVSRSSLLAFLAGKADNN